MKNILGLGIILIFCVVFLVPHKRHYFPSPNIIPDKKAIISNSLSHQMAPEAQEKLHNSIFLVKCKGVSIIEWKPSEGYQFTAPSKRAISIIDDACIFAKNEFLKRYPSNNPFYQEISLLPAIVDRDGLEPRNLNDIKFRFSNRVREYDGDNVIPIWGYTDHQSHTIFIRNDVLTDDGSLNNKFVTVFVHEMFHAMSWYYNKYENVSEDEKQAQQFTSSLGLGI